MRRVVVKLGSSVVSAEDGQLRDAVLRSACNSVAAAHLAGDELLLVSSGAIARGVGVMGLAERPRAVEELQAASAIGQGKVFALYDSLLGAHGLTAAQVLLTAMDTHERSRYVNARHALRTLLRWRAVPVINENDTTSTDEISFGDNDFLAAQVATLIEADLLVLLTDVEGLFSGDPRKDPQASLIAEVADREQLKAMAIGEGTSRWGTGGMRAKLLAAEIACAAGIETIVCSGLDRNALSSVLAGVRAGTRFPPEPSGESAFKLWLRYAKPSCGSLLVDAGAVRALLERGSSLLPVGIAGIEGDFQAGDAIDICAAQDKHLLAKGLTSYSSEELRRIQGLTSAEVRQLLGETDAEAVHRDRLVLA